MSYSDQVPFWQRDKLQLQSDVLCRRPLHRWLGSVIRDANILDIGCGTGYDARLFCRAGAGYVLGVDKNPELVTAALAAEKHQRRRIEYQVGDALALPIRESFFDLTTSVLVYGHLDQDQMDRANIEAYRVLRPGGTFVLAVPHPMMYMRRMASGLFTYNGPPQMNYWKTRSVDITLHRMDGSGSFRIPGARHHTLQAYLNSPIQCGFRLTGLLEPQLTEEDVAETPDLWSGEKDCPAYLILRFEK